MPQSLFEFGGSGPILNLAVANGFPPQTYAPMIAPLLPDVRALCLPPRPLWTDPPLPESVATWESLADDLLAGMDAFGLDQIIAAGHSFGAIGSVIAAARQPERFRALILLDPTLFEPSWFAAIDAARAQDESPRLPLSEQALRRRAHFADVDEAFAYWRGKALFAGWSDEALWLYARALTTPAPDGGLMLTWPPEWEARYYDTIWTHSWEDIARLPDSLPVLVLRGAASDTLLEPAARLLRERLPWAEYHEVSGGHLFPHSAPDETAEHIRAFLKGRVL